MLQFAYLADFHLIEIHDLSNLMEDLLFCSHARHDNESAAKEAGAS
jgi:hypothetical protein